MGRKRGREKKMRRKRERLAKSKVGPNKGSCCSSLPGLFRFEDTRRGKERHPCISSLQVLWFCSQKEAHPRLTGCGWWQREGERGRKRERESKKGKEEMIKRYIYNSCCSSFLSALHNLWSLLGPFWYSLFFPSFKKYISSNFSATPPSAHSYLRSIQYSSSSSL